MFPPSRWRSRESLAGDAREPERSGGTQAPSTLMGARTGRLQNSLAISTAELLKLIIPLFPRASLLFHTHSLSHTYILPLPPIPYTPPTKAHYILPRPR